MCRGAVTRKMTDPVLLLADMNLLVWCQHGPVMPNSSLHAAGTARRCCMSARGIARSGQRPNHTCLWLSILPGSGKAQGRLSLDVWAAEHTLLPHLCVHTGGDTAGLP